MWIRLGWQRRNLAHHVWPGHCGLVRSVWRAQPVACGRVETFVLSDIGEGLYEVEVLKWFVKAGDHVEQFDPLCQVESDKATAEIPSGLTGKLVKLYHQEGDLAKVGHPLVDVELTDDAVAEEDLASQQGDTDHVAAPEVSAPPQDTMTPVLEPPARRVVTAPAVRRLLAEHGLGAEEAAQIPCSGRGGRLLKADVVAWLSQRSSPTPQAPLAPPALPLTPSPVAAPVAAPSDYHHPQRQKEDRDVNIRGKTRTIIKTMTASLDIPHFGLSEEIRVDPLVMAREQGLKAQAAQYGIRLTLMPFFLKAASLAMLSHPVINASFYPNGMHGDRPAGQLIHHAAHNIGVAVDSPSGLVVPCIHHVEQRSVLEVAAELNRLQDLAKEDKLAASDLSGVTITLSNVGIIGGTMLRPRIMAPQTTLGAFGRI